MTRNFMELARPRWAEGKFVCVGLDTDLGKIPEWFQRKARVEETGCIIDYNRAIVDATKDLVCAYKPNAAFYEARGTTGITTLRMTCAYVREVAPEVPIIVDAKRADIGNTNQGYVEFLFDYLGADAVTVHPYLGYEAMTPFLEREGKQVFVLCRTSNPGAGEFQDRLVRPTNREWNRWTGTEFLSEGHAPEIPLYELVAHAVANDWAQAGGWSGNCGVVAGATAPEELARIRQIVGAMPILIPGVGAQGGDVEAAVKAGADGDGEGFLVNSSRGIIFASDGRDFAEVARAKTAELSDQINRYRPVPA